MSSLDSCGNGAMPACSGTHPAIGMNEAIALINAASPAADARRGMVIVGDGQPNPSGAAQPYDGSCGGNCTAADLESMATLAADAADAQDISVFTVFFDENNDAVAADFFEGLVRGEGTFVKTDDPADLADLLVGICRPGPLRLVR